MASSPKVIVGRNANGVLRENMIASEAMTPGHMVEIGGSNDVQLHSTAGGNAMPWFVLPPSGVEPSGLDIDEAYASGDTVRIFRPFPGEWVYAFLADSNNATEGTLLESDGAGGLQNHTAPSQAVNEGGTATYTVSQNHLSVVAVVPKGEAVNNSSGSQSRILIEVAR